MTAAAARKPALRCVYRGCEQPVWLDPIPDDPWHFWLRHGKGEAAIRLPSPRDDHQIDVLMDYVAEWVLDVHEYEDEG